VLQGEVLIRKLFSIDRFATGTISAGEVTALDHEIGNNAMELTTLKAKSFLARAQGAEVLGGFRDNVGKERKLNATNSLAVDRNVEENLWVGGHP